MRQRRRVLEVQEEWIRMRDERFLFSVEELVFCEGDERGTHNFAFHEFVWEVYEFFHFCFPDLGVALK